MGLERKLVVLGEERTVYVRLNNFDAVSKDEAVARFRAFPSEEILRRHVAGEIGGNIIIEEWLISFVPDVTKNLWKQGYAAFDEQVTKAEAAG